MPVRTAIRIELLKEIRDGRPTFYTQAVDGFTLEDYFANPGRYRDELPSSAVQAKAKELLNAVEWLYGKGFVHLDMNLGNIMQDRASGELALIDFRERQAVERRRAELQPQPEDAQGRPSRQAGSPRALRRFYPGRRLRAIAESVTAENDQPHDHAPFAARQRRALAF